VNGRPELRIGDQEREAAVAALGEHYAAGRVTKDEYDERAERAWAAKTNSDLMPLFLDLPPLPSQRGAHPQRPGGRSGRSPLLPPALPGQGPEPRRSSGWGNRLPLLPVFVLLFVLVGLDLLPWPLALLGVFVWFKLALWVGRRPGRSPGGSSGSRSRSC
jgi:hypothetical protein